MENKIKLGELYFDNNLIFCKDNGDYIDNKKPNRHLKVALKKAGIKTDIHYHSLRHIFITNCLSKDINPRTVMDLVGHTDIKMTMLVYAEFYVFPTIFVTFNFQIYIIVTLNLGLISFQVSKTLYFPR